MALSIAALFVYIFGAYAYGYLLVLWGRHRSFAASGAFTNNDDRMTTRAGVRLFAMCALWFVLLAMIEFRALLGDPRQDDWLDLSVLVLVFAFPGVIFHSYLLATLAGRSVPARARRTWTLVLWALYAAGLGFGLYVFAAIFNLVQRPQAFNQWIGGFIGGLFTVMSLCSLALIRAHPRRGGTDAQRRLGSAINVLFVVMIIVLIAMNVIGSEALQLVGRATPLLFLLVSVYYENRFEFYDLVIKRGVLLLISLVLTGTVLAVSLGSLSSIPEGPVRPWVFAVLLLPVAMFMPWVHDRVGRLLDHWWFGREFTPVEAVKQVLAAMQQAADEPTLVIATEATLSEMFRRRIVIARGEEVPERAGVVIDIRTTADGPARLAVINEPGTRPMLSEDVTLLRSLGGVFGYMLDNVRLQRRRLEQEQLAQELRLQSSRSELKALRAQINPHFLFNALNAIASLIHTDPARADLAVEQLAEVFRYTLRRSEQEWAPLDQELAFARAYLNVEQARFGKRLQYEIHADTASARAQVPAMLLQTLVENAVKHGISHLRSPGRIDIHVMRANGSMTLEVRDTGPGPGQSTSAVSGEGFGLRSVRDRLQGHFAERASLDLRREAGVTIARIQMPIVEDLSPTASTAR